MLLLLAVNAATGVVKLTGDPNYETKNSYSFTVTATDDSGNTSAATTVTFAITNGDESKYYRNITSGNRKFSREQWSWTTLSAATADANDGGTIARLL